MARHQILPAYMNFFVTKCFNFLLFIFTIAYLVCLFIILPKEGLKKKLY